MSGYVVAQDEGGDELDAILAELGSILGVRLLRPLAAALADAGASAVCLVPMALLVLLPLHALQWDTPSGQRCLIDNFDVLFAPSAAVRTVCLRRAASRGGRPHKLLAVGNPLPHPDPLPYSEPEAEMVARTLLADDVEILLGSAATKRAVVAKIPGTTHLHLACHGTGHLLGAALTASLSFANDERLSAREIVDLDASALRLVVASACQTAVVQEYEAVDEVLGLATAFLGAGAASVIATLWPVDDYATSLVMSRFYELLNEADSPNDATDTKLASLLRSAQLWLRSLTVEDEQRYIQNRPILRAQSEAKTPRATSRLKPHLTEGPYSAPSYWAPFVLTGA